METTSLSSMSRNLFFNSLFFAVAMWAQAPATVDVSAPDSHLYAARPLPPQATAFTEAGATISGIGFQWTSSAPAIASVSQSGNVRGLTPGIADITAADPSSGVSGHMLLRVLPLRIELDPPNLELRIGASTKLTARALDADTNPIAGVSFRFSSDLPGVATVALDGSVTPIDEGTVAILSHTDVASS